MSTASFMDTAIKQAKPTVSDYLEALRPITDRAWQDRSAYKNKNGKTGWSDKALTPARIREHLVANEGCGVGFIVPGESTTRLALFDLDSHNGGTPFSEMAALANRLCTQLEVIGLQPTVFRSSGGAGLHIWMMWDDPQDAYSVIQALTGVLSAEGLTEGTAGVAQGEVEIFPKQSAVDPDRHPNMAILPLWNKSELLVDELGLRLELTPAGKSAVIGMTWPMSEPVPYIVNPAPEREQSEHAAPDPLDKIARALTAVAPLADDLSHTGSSATNYETWRNVLYAVHEASGGSEDAFDLFKEWEDRNPVNAGRRPTRATWDGCQDNKEGKVTRRATLYGMAYKLNPEWDAPTADGLGDTTDVEAPENAATSDVANARRLAKLMAEKYVYAHGGQGWCKYKDGVYSQCSRGEQMEAAKTLGGLILREANSLDPEKMKKTMAQASRAMSATGISAALLLAQSDPQIAIDPTDMDSDPDLLNTENCIVHLPTGKAMPHSPSVIMGRQCKAPYIAEAACPQFKRFLLEISNNDPEWVADIQRLVGYTISGRVNEEIIVFLLGWGANGKSVFSNIMRRILNNYAASVPANFLMVSNRDGEAATPSLARLPGVRMVQANEVEAGARLSAQTVKIAASSDAIAARHLHKAAFEFVPTHTLWVRGNHKPIITDTDDGIWRRIRLMPFERKFGPDEKDVRLEDKLMAEAPGILAWMVQGHQEYLKHGLRPAKRVADASIAYRKDSDLVAQWITDRADRVPGCQWLQSLAYQDYKEWCGEQGLKNPMSKRSFTLALDERGVDHGQESTGSRGRVYVGLRPLMF